MPKTLIILASLFCIAGFTQLSLAAEPAWWTQQKIDCGLPANLDYATWTAEGSPCNNGSSNNSGPSPEQMQQNQNITDASALNQQGLAAMNQNDYDGALGYFQQALEKTPDDTAIQQNLQNAQNKIAARNKFKQDQNDALGDMRDISNGGDFDSSHTSNNSGQNDSGFRDINASENSGGGSASAVNTDTNVVDLRGIKDLGIDPAKLKTQTAAETKKLVRNPAYNAAMEDAVAAFKSGDVQGKNVAIEKARNLQDLVVLPKDEDMKYLFNEPDEATISQILKGDALPTWNADINKILANHPGMKPQLLSIWQKSCRRQTEDEEIAMVLAVKDLNDEADCLGLPYGHIQETLDKNPQINAQWKKALWKITYADVKEETLSSRTVHREFDAEMRKLAEKVNEGDNPYELK